MLMEQKRVGVNKTTFLVKHGQEDTKQLWLAGIILTGASWDKALIILWIFLWDTPKLVLEEFGEIFKPNG